jgi:hypothetical protein
MLSPDSERGAIPANQPGERRSGGMNLQTRVTNILTRPKEEWPVIAAEPADVASLYRDYIAILALIPPVASFIGLSIIGVTLPLYPSVGTFRYGIAQGLGMAVIQYVIALIGVYVAALVIDRLAPTFQSQPDSVQSLKLVAYSATAGWVAGVLYIIPALGVLVLLAGLYGVYIFYLGVPLLMKTPKDRVIPFMIVSAIVIIIVMAVASALTTALTGSMFVVPKGL